MEWTLGFAGIVLLVVGLVGQAFEMRKIRLSTTSDGEMGSPSIFTDKRNFKWYAIIGAGIILWYIAERI
jgi:hypothetical protein